MTLPDFNLQDMTRQAKIRSIEGIYLFFDRFGIYAIGNRVHNQGKSR